MSTISINAHYVSEMGDNQEIRNVEEEFDVTGEQYLHVHVQT